MVEKDSVKSMLLHGPSGIGKTTIARCLANDSACEFIELNATNSKIADIRKVISQAEARKKNGTTTIMFVDECLAYNTSVIVKLKNKLELFPIGYIVENKIDCLVLSMNKNGEDEWKPINDWSSKKSTKIVNIEIEDDDGQVHVLECSENHLIFTTNRGYVEAANLTEEDEIVDTHAKIKHGLHEFS